MLEVLGTLTDSFLVSVGGDGRVSHWLRASSEAALGMGGQMLGAVTWGMLTPPRSACVLDVLDLHFCRMKRDGQIVPSFFLLPGDKSIETSTQVMVVAQPSVWSSQSYP